VLPLHHRAGRRVEEARDFTLRVKLRFETVIPNKQKKLIIAVGLVVASVACLGGLLPIVARSSNCGGNSAALAACKSVAAAFHLTVSGRNGKPVSAAGLTDVERDYFNPISGLNWLAGAKVLVTPVPVRNDDQQQQVLAVCDKPFSNLPRRIFGKAPPTHAIAYTDGSTSLISVEEFRRLDLREFIDVKSLQPTNSARIDTSEAPKQSL
jgi:hypothetical protein